jgi:minimal PKS acyl carrier protein
MTNTTRQLTLDRLRDILERCAGADSDTPVLDDSGIDVTFPDLGYDSLALLNTLGRIEIEYGVRLPDDTFADETLTPRTLIERVNQAASTAG